AELTLRTHGDDKGIQKCMNGIIKASSRAKELVSQILTYCRRSDGEEDNLRPTIVTPIVKEVIALQQKSLPPEVEVVRVLKAEDDTVMADATKIHQVLMNLCTNAGYAMRGRDNCVLEVRTANFVHDRRSKSKYQGLVSGQYMEIAVSDTGTGIDAETLGKIFQPFFTTKAKGEGTGMGLSVVEGIIRSFKGSIAVESQLGVGSTFYVALPTMEKMAEDSNGEEVLQELPKGTEKILIVDDEMDILSMEEDMLLSLGYRTVCAQTAADALRLYKEDPDSFDLVLTDQVMPEMKGAELVETLLTITPDLPIVFCTGFSEDFTREEAMAIGVKEFLVKPIIIADLASSVRHALDRIS
ncbi:MAG: response regulator, partial [Lentisphaerae bacterium]|nr:response regulator [Lentisphaerota bacterium]